MTSQSVLLMGSCRFLVFAVASLAATGQLPAAGLAAATLQFLHTVALSLFARYENDRSIPFTFPAMPLSLAGIPLLDGAILMVLVGPVWFLAGLAGCALTLAGQRYVRGD